MLFKKKKKEEPAKKEAPKKSDSKKAPVKKEAPKKAEPKKAPAKKEAPKKSEPKKAPTKKEAPKKSEPAKEKADFRVYHISKRAEDKKWQIKFATGEKAIKLFDTQKEAIEYANVMAANQDGSVLVHASKGENKGRIKKK